MYPFLLDTAKSRLFETISCVCTEQLNGEYMLTLQYPVGGQHINSLRAGGMIVATVPSWDVENGQFVDKFRQEDFDIYKTETTIDGVLTVYAQHTSRRLSGNIYTGTKIYGDISYMTGKTAPAPAVQLYGVADSSKTLTVSDTPKSLLACIVGSDSSMASTWNYEFAFRYNTSGGVDTTEIWQFTRRGANRQGKVFFGVNMLSINAAKDKIAAFNAIVPYAIDNGAKKYILSGGAPQAVYPTNPPNEPVFAVPMDFTDYFNGGTITDAGLRTAAKNYLDTNQPWLGEDTLEVDFVNGTEIDPHAAPIWLGDTVQINWADADLKTFVRVVGYEYDVLREKYNKMSVGAKQTEFVAINNGVSYGGTSGGAYAAGTDYIVEHGTSGIWTYRKWASGIAECWGQSDVTVTSTTTWSSPIQYYATPVQKALPSGLFTSVDTCDAQVGSVAGQTASDFWLTSASGYSLTTTDTQGVYLVRVGSASNKQVVIYWHVKGRWS